MRSSASVIGLPPLAGITVGNGGRCAVALMISDVFAIARDERCPLEPFAGSHHHRFGAIDRNLHDVTAIDVVGVSSCVSGEDADNVDRC